MRRWWREEVASYAAIALACALWMAPLLSGLGDRYLVWREALFSDLIVSHLPLSVLVHDAVIRWGQVPLWNPLWLGGQPLLADPLAAMLYPPHWLTFLFPAIGTYNVLLFLHLVWTGVGQYQLTRELGMSRVAAYVAASAWAGLPKLLGTVGLGHVTLVYAVSWTPWLLLAVHRAAGAAGGGGGWLRSSLRVGGVLGVIFLADPRWLLPSGLLAAAYAAFVVVQGRPAGRGWLRIGLGAGAAAATAATLSAGLAWPLVELVPRTTRAALDPEVAGELGASGTDLLGLLLPNPLHWPEVNVAVGVVVLTLALSALVVNARRHWFWGVMALGFLLLAMGNGGVVYPLLARLAPAAGLLRVPARFLLLFGLCVSTLAGFGVEDLGRGRLTLAPVERTRLALVGFFALVVGVAVGLMVLIGPNFIVARPGVGAAMLFAGLGVLAALLALARGPDLPAVSVGIAVLIVLELTFLNLSALEARRPVSAVPESFELALSRGWGRERAFSPTYSLPQAWAARAGTERADGIDPLQLKAYWEFMAEAVGYEPSEYSVTLPPFPEGDPSFPHYTELDTDRLGLLNVAWIVASHPVSGEHLVAAGQSGRLWMYENKAARPRAWIQDSSALDAGSDWQATEFVVWSPNRIIVRAAGPGWLILAQNADPGWVARIDGNPVPTKAAEGLLQAVELPEGEHVVLLDYRPRSALIGLGLTFIGLLSLLVSELTS